jgi:hypothetical protein
MNLTVQESRAACKAGHVMGQLLTDEGPAPFERAWVNGEREERAKEVSSLMDKIKANLASHNRLCPHGTKCHRHGMDHALSKLEVLTLLDCLSVAHLLLNKTSEENYLHLKYIRTVLFKVGSFLAGMKR